LRPFVFAARERFLFRFKGLTFSCNPYVTRFGKCDCICVALIVASIIPNTALRALGLGERWRCLII
jgi:hypothetical protein